VRGLAAPALVLSALLGAEAAPPASPPAASPEDPRAQSLKRGDAYAELIAAGLAVARGHAADAVRHINAAVALEPQSSSLHAQGAALLALLGRRSDAERLAQSALEIDPAELEAVRVLADLEASRSFGPKADAAARLEAIRLYERLAQDDPDAPDEIWAALARLKLASGDAEGASVAAARFLSKRPGDANALRLYDQTLVAAGKTQEALDRTLQWLRAHPDDEELVPLIVEMARETGSWSTIESLCTELIGRDPDNARARALRGEARLRLGRPKEALDDLELARATTPRDPLLRLHVAAAYQALNRLADATQLGESLVSEYPDNSFVHILLAETLARRGEISKAREEYVVALQVITGQDDDDIARRDEVRARLAAIDLTAERYDQARTILAALERPDAPDALVLRARAALAWGDAKEAKRLAKLVAAAEPEESALLDGEAELKLGHTTRAAESFDRAIKQGGPEIRGDVAAVWRRGGHDTEAESELRAWTAAKPEDSEARLALGSFLERGGRYTEAETELRAAIRLAPGSPEALNYLGYSLADRGERLDDSVVLIRRALEIDPHNGAYLDSLGWAYFRQGRAEDARAALEQAVREFPRDATVLEHLGDVHAALGDNASARTYWQRALDAGPDSKEELERKLGAAAAHERAP
jgi:tetratricopeptide (TPR) repeat protein